MDESVFNVIYSIPEWLGSWLTTALGGLTAVIALYLFFHFRAGSSYGFINRLYAMLIGGSEFHQDSVANFWRERKDVERFNALFKTNAKSLHDIQKFISWIENNELDLRKFTGLQDWFDFEKRKVKKMKAWQLTTPFAFALLAYFSSMPIIKIASADAALIKLNDEKQWMWVNHTEVRSSSINPFRDKNKDWILKESACSKMEFDTEKVAKSIQLKKKSINIICESFSNADDAEVIDGIITDQKMLWPVAIALWLFALCSFTIAVRRANATHARPYLLNKLKKARLRRVTSAPSNQSSPPGAATTDVAS